jgi:hypothetical protein
MSSDTDDRLELENRHLRVQNRRYRELIQSLSSLTGVLRKRLAHTGSGPPELEVFERFGSTRASTAELLTGDRTKSKAASPTSSMIDAEPDNAPRPLAPLPGWGCLAADKPLFRMGFTLLGMTAEEVERAVELVERRQLRSRDFAPVFVTDLPDFTCFRARGYVVEYIPGSISQHTRKQKHAERYLRRRLELISAKWALRELVDLSG